MGSETGLVNLQYALDTFYLLMCGTLVVWMAAGFTMLEAGLVRAKNTTDILTKNAGLYAVACVTFALVGYDLAFGGSGGGFLPDAWFATRESIAKAVELRAGDEARHAPLAHFFFQTAFVATSMSIISGAVAERMKLWAFLFFAVVFTGLTYPLQAMWSWGGGWLQAAGFQDFAGAGVVHLTGATAALAAVLLLGPRAGKYGADGQTNAIPGANLPLATLGMFVLWIGWFGFNGGSLLKVSGVEAADTLAAIFLNTNAAACGGLLVALVTSRVLFGKSDLTMAINGALAGLVSITAAPAHWAVGHALLVGAFGGGLVVLSILLMERFRIDDPVGAISVHGICAIWSLLAACLSGNEAVTFGAQLLGIVTIIAWSFSVSLLVWAVLKATMGIRVGEQDEYEGLDLSECGMDAYPEFTLPGGDLSEYHGGGGVTLERAGVARARVVRGTAPKSEPPDPMRPSPGDAGVPPATNPTGA